MIENLLADGEEDSGLDAFDALVLPATEGGKPIFYDLTEVFEGLAVGLFLLDFVDLVP